MSAGGAWSAGALVLLLLATMPVLLVLTRRSLPVWQLAPLTALLQLGWHEGLMRAVTPAAAAASATASDCSGHGRLLLPAMTPGMSAADPTGSHGDLLMTLLHALAGVLIAAWVRYGESTIRAIAGLIDRLVPQFGPSRGLPELLRWAGIMGPVWRPASRRAGLIADPRGPPLTIVA